MPCCKDKLAVSVLEAFVIGPFMFDMLLRFWLSEAS